MERCKPMVRKGISTIPVINIITILLHQYHTKRAERKQQATQKKALAQEILPTFYSIREVIRHIRNPQSYHNPDGRATFFEVEGRYNDYLHLFSQVESLRYRAIDLLAKSKAHKRKIATLFKEPRDIASELLTVSRILQLSIDTLSNTQRVETIHEKKSRLKEENHYKKKLYRLKGDKIDHRVEKMVHQIERLCQRVL